MTLADDLIEAFGQDVDWNPSAVSTINGEDAVPFLTQFAVINTPGNVEPNADYNDLMSSPAGDVRGLYSTFEGNTIFYPGENITFNFENGSTTGSLPWLALYSPLIADSPPSLATGQDLYDYFVLGQAPASNSSAATSFTAASSTVAGAAATTTGSADATPSNWGYPPAYPNDPVVSQPNLGLVNGGVVSGYFLNDGITAILSIPSFDVTAEAVASFSSTVSDFLQKSKAAGRTRIIIDLQRNDGGSDLLAIDAFKQVRHPLLRPIYALTSLFSFSQLSIHLVRAVCGLTRSRMHLATHSLLITQPSRLILSFMNNCQRTSGLLRSTLMPLLARISAHGPNFSVLTQITEISLQRT